MFLSYLFQVLIKIHLFPAYQGNDKAPAGDFCQNETEQLFGEAYKYLSKSFLYYFFSASVGETRLFPLSETHHSGKKPGFFPGQILKIYG
ncbi:Uncharacterized protein dnm_018040 [Desulfonema magnum]|uniref:Uncharacterized protein n=1 Tax=Desulfonema magnum TaxID=45655 RepID=A0A975BHE5_9BACT|nr:Uncharacterized protein dnm_018040 [Desulfonema magnum]